MHSSQKIELLSPAKNLEFGKIAINHGADAVYIGAPKFGARAAVGNTIDDINQLVKYAHIYGAKVFVAFNTLLYDNELAESEKLINQLYNAGIDALIIQDMGILELDLPPITLHASTQTHNYELEKVKFLEKVGFKRVILARELSLAQIQEIRENTQVELESFIHGALCVCYSGQCYMSQSLTGRSGNRGVCSQPCRSSYDLYNQSGVLLQHNAHLLSLKDFNATNYIQQLIASGICSLKIEGRLKDITYLKNITAHYRMLLDAILQGRKDVVKASSGKTTIHFVPDVEKSFNRGYTNYFLEGRAEKTASVTTQKSIGKQIGEVQEATPQYFILQKKHDIVNGDGLCYFNAQGVLDGFLVNNVNGNKIYPNKEINLEKGTVLYRNNDLAFEKKLAQQTSDRKIAVQMHLQDFDGGIRLTLDDEDGVEVYENWHGVKEIAKTINNYEDNIKQQLSKLGNTPFEAQSIQIAFKDKYFLQASVLNTLRRNAVRKLIEKRIEHFYPHDVPFVKNNYPYFTINVDYRTNILNEKAVQFYKRHGVEQWEYGFEKQKITTKKVLMTTKHCIKYQLEQCPKYFKQSKEYAAKLYLHNNSKEYWLEFDCKNCEMKIIEK